MSSLKKTARIAGILYLVILLTSVYGHMYVPMQIFVRGDAAGTAANILRNEVLFRTCIVAGLIETAAFFMLGLVLYRLLKEIDRRQARLMLAMIGVQIPLALVFAVLKYVALMMLKTDEPGIMPGDQAPVLVMMILNIIRYGNSLLGIVAGLWLLPLGILVFRSGFIPRLLGMLLLLSGAGSVVHSLFTVLFPAYTQSPVPAFVFFILGEIPIMLWLLVKGVRDHISIDVLSERKIRSAVFSGPVRDLSD